MDGLAAPWTVLPGQDECGELRGRKPGGGLGVGSPRLPAWADSVRPSSRDAPVGVMVKASPAMPFVVLQPDLLLQLLAISFGDRAMFGQHEFRQSGAGRLFRMWFPLHPCRQVTFIQTSRAVILQILSLKTASASTTRCGMSRSRACRIRSRAISRLV